jgi:2-methylcitrate dehydratase PrpD
VDEPKGDPGNTLSRPELEQKARALAEFGGAATEAELRAVFATLWNVTKLPVVGRLL